jgi:NAD(P)H-flavin reductase
MTTKSKLPLRLLRNDPLTADTSLLTFALPLGLALGCRPGQFFNLRPLDSTAPLLRRPISICDVRPKENEVDFLIQVIGDGTRLLCETRPGAEVDAVGPLGTSFQTDPTRPALMVAGGVGVAPLYFLARQMRREAASRNMAGRAEQGLAGGAARNMAGRAEQGLAGGAAQGLAGGGEGAGGGAGSVPVRARPCPAGSDARGGSGEADGASRGEAGGEASAPITFCYGARNASHFVLLDRIEREVSRLVLATEDGSRGAKGLVTEAARGFLQPGTQIFVCGPPAMMQALLTMMRERGLEGQFSLENQMGCGVGACMGCVVPAREGFLRVCCDGPVVNSNQLDSVFTG